MLLTSHTLSSDFSHADQPLCLLILLQWIGVDELRKDVMSVMARETDASGQTDLYALAEHLALLNHWRQVTVRTGLTLHTGIRDGSNSTALFKQLRHSFLLVQPSAAGTRFLA